MIPKKRSSFLIFIIFISICEVSCDQKSSVAFVLDVTGSMFSVIGEVKTAVDRLFKAVLETEHSQIEDFVLVTFDDAGPNEAYKAKFSFKSTKLRTITKDSLNFTTALNKISSNYNRGGDCPEYSLSGVMLAIEKSRPRSTIYVFTDAEAKDHIQYEDVKNLAMKKQSKVHVIFVNTGLCWCDELSAQCFVYERLAKSTSGMVYNVTEFELQEFELDDKNKEPTITVTGSHPEADVIGPKGEYVKTLDAVKTSHILVKEIVNATPGVYTAIVGSDSMTRVKVTARTEIILQYGFSSIKAASINDTTTRPLPDDESMVYIQVTDGNIDLKNIAIIDVQSGHKIEIPLKLYKEKEKLYKSELVELPTSAFKMEISGVDPSTKKLITRIVPRVEPHHRVKTQVSIAQGTNIGIDYNGAILLTCRVTAYPAPKIIWYNSTRNVLNAKRFIKEEPYDYISFFQVINVQKPETYYCEASSRDDTKEAKIDIKPWFEINSVPSEKTYVKYGEKQELLCDVSSPYAMDIEWNTPLKPSDYTLSADKKMLTIKSVDLSAQGRYTCKATLKSNHKNIAFNTNIMISDLTSPVISATPNTVTVTQGVTTSIMCKIAGGVPRPRISWQKLRKNIPIKLIVSGEELTLHSASLSDAGLYRCIAENEKGQAEKTIELIVQTAPEVSIDEGSAVTVQYGSTIEFNCRVVAFPLEKLIWKDSSGNILHATNTTEQNDMEVASRLKLSKIKASEIYYCYAENKLGKNETSVRVSVSSPFDVISHPPETTSIKYKNPALISCDVKSSFPMRMRWFYQKNEHSPRSEIHASDKYTIIPDERSLRIESTDLDLVGKYTCEASLVNDENEKKSYTTSVEINNLRAPEITYHSKPITVMNGHSMSAFCIADGVPKPVVTWQFKSRFSDMFTDMPDKGEWIIKPKIAYAWAGSYICTATNRQGTQSRTIDVTVHGKPEITNSASEYFGVTGDKVLKIPCDVIGVPEPSVTWKTGGKIIYSDAKLLVDKNALYIKNPTENDSNNFTCEAENVKGYDTKQFQAIISDFIDIDEVFKSNIYLKQNESTDIKCLLTHSNPQSIRWFVNGEITTVVGTFYPIKNAQFSNDGNYTCRLNTEEGSESVNYVVDVGYKPTFKTLPSSTVYWKGNKDQYLDCTVYEKPAAKVEWFYNKKQLPFNGTLPELAISGWGEYTCKVSNVHGTVQRTFNVTSDECIIDRTADKIQNTPLLFDDELAAWPKLNTENVFFIINQNQIIILECATLDQPTNTFRTHSNAKRIEAECFKEDKFKVDGKIYNFNDLQCVEYVKSSQRFPTEITERSCMQNGTIVEIGFKLNEGFLEVYEVCYSNVDHKTLYTKVVMSEVNIGNIVSSSFKLHQENTSGSDVEEPQYKKGWLVNPVDVTFGPAQTATLSDQYNAVPVYEQRKNSLRWSWSIIETIVRSTLDNDETVTVWTGASQYNSSSGIPRYLWKVVMFVDETFETIVYVNAANPSSSDILCQESTWDRLSYEFIADAADRYSYTCSMDDFLKAFKLPKSDFI